MQRCFWIVFAMLITLSPAGTCQTPPPHAAPTPHLGRQAGLFDSLKQGSSSHGIDYGQRIEEARSVLVESTIKSNEFWIASVCLSLNVALFLYVLYMDRVRRRVIRSTARLVVQYQSQLAAGHRSYLLLQQDYAKFVTDFEQEKEPRISTRPSVQRGRSTDDTRTNGTDPRPGFNPAKPAVRGQAQVSLQASATAAPADDKGESMRRQITTLTHQLEEERKKNRKLQGE
jgi:hypothetical protein